MTTLHYAFHAARTPAGTDPLVVIAMVRTGLQRLTPAPLSGQEASRQRALAASAHRALPSLVEVGRRDRRRDVIELAVRPATHDDPSIRLALRADHADLVVTVGRHDPRLAPTFASAWRILAALADAGLTIYDPQRDRLVDVASDLDAVVGQFQERVEERRPWWQLW